MTVTLQAWPGERIVAPAALCSPGAHGVMMLNDFRPVEGNQQAVLGSLPARLGPKHACRLACVVIAGPQVAAVALLASWGTPMVRRVADALPGAWFVPPVGQS